MINNQIKKYIKSVLRGIAMTSATEFIDEPDTIRNETIDNGLLVTDNQTTELQSLSKLKLAGKLHFWRGTIEIPEIELHAICDEIQAEHNQAIITTLREPNVLYMRGQPDTDYTAITAIEVDGQRFERVKECELEYHNTG